MANSKNRRGKDAAAIAADLMLAPAVMWMRTPLMAGELTKVPDARSESARAVNEKIAAAHEGVANAQLSYLQSFAAFWPEVMSGQTPSIWSGVANERAINAALKPASRRVKSNFKRLGKI